MTLYLHIKKICIFFLLFCFNKNYDISTVAAIHQFRLIHSYNTNEFVWFSILSGILRNPLFFEDIRQNSIILVNMTYNATNNIFQTTKITNILIDLIAKNINKCHVISMEELYDAYREFKISSEEILNSYEFSVEIARYLNADYIIYSKIYNDQEELGINLQLISSKTGEIIRTFSQLIYQDNLFN